MKKTKSHEEEDVTWLYDSLVQYITQPMFRGPIKEFVEENCYVFEPVEENKFEYTEIHKKFITLIETLLQNMLTDLGASEQQFVLAARKGLHSKQNKKYFEQLIACNNFEYFKNMMVKKNLQLDEQAYKMLHENLVKQTKQNLQQIIKADKDYQKHQAIKEKVDLKVAEDMEKIVNEEQQKLNEDVKEFEHIKNAFDFSKKKDLVVKGNSAAAAPAKGEDEEISLYSNNLKDKKLKPIVAAKTSDAGAKETLKQLEQADKDKKTAIYTSPIKKVEAEPAKKETSSPKKVVEASPKKVEASPSKAESSSTKAEVSPKKVDKPSLKPVETKIEYKPIAMNVNLESKVDSETKKKLEADLQNSLKDSKQLESQYDQLQKDKENKLKEYRDMIMKMKKDKRTLGKNETTVKEDDKKKAEQRQSLAEKLKK